VAACYRLSSAWRLPQQQRQSAALREPPYCATLATSNARVAFLFVLHAPRIDARESAAAAREISPANCRYEWFFMSLS